VVAGTLGDTDLRLATLPADRVTSALIDRLNREYLRGDSTTLIKRHHPPVNILAATRHL
jgi:hypothetical protein